MTKKEVPINANKFSCERCDFQCSKESNYNRHLMTRKHKIRTNTNEKVPKNAEQYYCNCGKKYKHSSSLWNHKKNCENEGNHGVQQTQINPSIDNENLVNYLMNENMELKKMIMGNYGQNVTNNFFFYVEFYFEKFKQTYSFFKNFSLKNFCKKNKIFL